MSLIHSLILWQLVVGTLEAALTSSRTCCKDRFRALSLSAKVQTGADEEGQRKGVVS